ncbi:MAG TPA: peptidylprolyl isomerase [Alphaproteobacteria bacterium]|nr:peptidylprolyl isomerase [Alphaproteobacteria bacterium]
MIGAGVFGLYALVAGGEREDLRDTIVVTEGRVQQLAEVFAKTWQRPPTQDELRGLVDAYVKEEVYYREALKLGLDRDDTLIRRRMQQKMEFVTEPSDEALKPDDDALQAYLDGNKDAFRVEPRIAFDQVFLNPKKVGAPAADRAKQTLEALKASAPGNGSELGDPTLLPAAIELSPLSAIARNFGEAFATNLADLPDNEWAGPFKSPYGLHLVRVTKRVDGYDPKLAEVRDAVMQAWRTEQREAFQAKAYGDLFAKYEVVLPAAEDEASSPEAAP